MMVESSKEVGVWDGLAKRYETIVRLFDRSYPAIRAKLEEDLRGRERVLEVAAGTGQFTEAIARVAKRLVATDVSPEMVARLSGNVRSAGLTNVAVEVMSAYALDAGDGEFDAVVCANALHVMREPKRALLEFRRVLRPGGALLVPTFLHAVDGLRRNISRGLSKVSPFVAHTRFELRTLCELLESAGFVVERAEQLPGLFPIGYVRARVGVAKSAATPDDA